MAKTPNILQSRDRIYRSLFLTTPNEKAEVLFYRVRDQIKLKYTYYTQDLGGKEMTHVVEEDFTSWQAAYDRLESQLSTSPYAIAEDSKSPYYGKSKYDRAYQFLCDVAKRKQIVTYMELEVEAGIHRNHEASAVLDALSTQSYNASRILISSLVVNKTTGVPGEGYNAMCMKLGLRGIVSPKGWEDQVNLVWNFYNNK